MSNMSYCRFENTLAELRDCERYLDDDLSESEAWARDRLVEPCKKIVDHEPDTGRDHGVEIGL